MATIKSNLSEEELFEVQYGAYMRLVEAIILRVYDDITISGKWKNRQIGLETLLKKKDKLQGMNSWLNDWKWDTWLDIYCDYYGYNKKSIHRTFLKKRLISIKQVNKRIKETEKQNETESKKI